MIDRELLKDMGFELGSGWDHEVWVYDGDFWVHFGGESGPNARPMQPDWARSLRDQCKSAGVKFFMKQITERGRKIPFEQWPIDLQIREYPE